MEPGHVQSRGMPDDQEVQRVFAKIRENEAKPFLNEIVHDVNMYLAIFSIVAVFLILLFLITESVQAVNK